MRCSGSTKLVLEHKKHIDFSGKNGSSSDDAFLNATAMKYGLTIITEENKDAGDLVGLCANDYSWDAEIMGYICYDIGIEGTEPFVDYYYLEKTLSEDIETFDAEITDLGVSYEGKPAKLIRYTFKEVGDEEEYKECFVGFEYNDEDGKGLMGLKIGAFEEDLMDSYLLIPVRKVYENGGPQTYTSLTCKVIVWKQIDGKSGMEFYIFPNNFHPLYYYE